MSLNEFKTLKHIYGIKKMINEKTFFPIIGNDKLYNKY